MGEHECPICQLFAALQPFAEIASGIPDNWPADCHLRINTDVDRDGMPFEYLSYHGLEESIHPVLPTIGQWRETISTIMVIKRREYDV